MSDYFNATGTIGFTCDNCGRELLGCAWVNGMKFCAKCYQETFGNNTKEIIYVYGGNLKEHIKVIEEKDQKIADLEAKLAEKETRIAELEDKDWYEGTIKQLEEQNERLLNKLSEKWKDFENLKFLFDLVNNPKGQHTIRKANQDKISFAVAYLEIIKAFIIDKEFYFVGEDYSTVYVEDITEEIDNQIKQLKEMK